MKKYEIPNINPKAAWVEAPDVDGMSVSKLTFNGTIDNPPTVWFEIDGKEVKNLVGMYRYVSVVGEYEKLAYSTTEHSWFDGRVGVRKDMTVVIPQPVRARLERLYGDFASRDITMFLFPDFYSLEALERAEMKMATQVPPVAKNATASP